MKQEYYKELRAIARRSFEDSYHGLNIALENDPHFKKYMERNYRVKVYEQENDFYLTANERNFHFIGFIDAVIRLERMGLIVWDHAEQTVVENENEELDEDDCEEVLRCQQLFDRECEAMKKLILYVETGEE